MQQLNCSAARTLALPALGTDACGVSESWRWPDAAEGGSGSHSWGRRVEQRGSAASSGRGGPARACRGCARAPHPHPALELTSSLSASNSAVSTYRIAVRGPFMRAFAGRGCFARCLRLKEGLG